MDYCLFQQINSLAGQIPYLDCFGIFLAKYLPYFFPIAILVIFWKKWKIIFQVFLAAFVAKFVIVDIIRWIWYRPRPFVEDQVNLLIDKLDQAAFPSGHTAILFAISTVVYSYNKKAGIVFFLTGFLASFSRIFVGVHWPSDILAGLFVGLFSGWLVLRCLKK